MRYSMRLVRSCLVAIGLMSLVMLAIAGCSGGSSSTGTNGPVTGGTLVAGLGSEPKSMDPLISGLFVDREVQLNVFDTLVTVDTKGNIVADLATDWKFTDPTTLNFTLRSDVKFQDGTPFNADAVVFNINRYLTATGSRRKSELGSVKSVTAIDPTHAQFTLKAPSVPLLGTLTDRAGEMLSPTALQAAGADPVNNPLNMGTGPFKFKEWVKSDHLSLVKNPNYWGKDSSTGAALPYLDGVTYKFITDGTVMYTNLSTGTIQYADGISSQSVATAKANPSIIYKTSPGLSFFGFELNTGAAPFNDVHVRRAVAWAINRQEIVHSVFLDNDVVSQGPISPASWAYDASIAPYQTDVTKAKAELAQSSTPTPTFNLIITANSSQAAQEGTFILNELKPAGITVNLVPETFDKETTDTQAHNFQAALEGWSGRVDPDGNMYAWFHTGGDFNDMQYSNTDVVDKALEDARVQSDQAKRATDYQTAEKQIDQDAPYIFIDHGLVGQVSLTKLHNFPILATGIPEFGGVWLEH